MPKTAKKSSRKMRDNELEIAPDAWKRFEKAVDVVAKSPPQHRIGPKRKKRAAKKKRD
jgi:hypothetical protein